MKLPKRWSRHQTSRTSPARRARLLAAFERSGLSAAAFARRHGINYTTFCGWRQRRAKAEASPRVRASRTVAAGSADRTDD